MQFPVNSDQLNTLADWFDITQPSFGFTGYEVQGDLRELARRLEALSRVPEVVCLIGSTRFHEAFHEQNLKLTLEGKIVLSIGTDRASDTQQFGAKTEAEQAEVKRRLDALHLQKIVLADRVLCLNVGGYIGSSTSSELAYAMLLNKPVEFLEKTGVADALAGSTVHPR